MKLILIDLIKCTVYFNVIAIKGLDTSSLSLKCPLLLYVLFFRVRGFAIILVGVFFSVCEMQTDHKVFHIKCLVEGAVYKELGELEMAVQVCMLP